MVEVSFEGLRKVQLQERNYASLVNIEDEFYTAYSDFLSLQRKQLSDKFSFEGAMTFESTRKLLGDVVRRRQQKILLKAIRDFQGGEVSSIGLSKEEKTLYTSVIKLLAEYDLQVNPAKVESPAPQTPTSSAPQAPEAKKQAVKLLADVPEFVGVRDTVGPFSSQQVAELDPEDAKLLIEQGMAQPA